MMRGSVAKAGARVVSWRTTAQAIWGLTDLAKTIKPLLRGLRRFFLERGCGRTRFVFFKDSWQLERSGTKAKSRETI